MSVDLLRRFDLNLLVTLQVLLEECSVSRAAARLCLSPSAASRALTRLRRLFNDELFVRLPHGLQPTARALELATALTPLLESATQLTTPPRFDPALCPRHFTLSVTEQLSVQLIPALLRRLAQEAPAITIETRPWSESAVRDMARGQLDLCINSLALQEQDLCTRPLAPAPGAVFMARHHPCAQQKQITLAEYRACSHVRILAPSWPGLPASHARTPERADSSLLLATPDPHLACELVSQTHSLMTASHTLSGWWLKRYQLQALDLPHELQTGDAHYRMIWHKLTDRSPGHLWLRRSVRAVFEALINSQTVAQEHLRTESEPAAPVSDATPVTG